MKIIAIISTLLLALSPVSQAAVFPTNIAGSDTFAGLEWITWTNHYSATTDLFPCTAEEGEPDHGRANAARRTAWWAWQAVEDGYCTVDTRRTIKASSPVMDTTLAVYSGTSVNNLRLIAGNDDYDPGFQPDSNYSSVTFYASAGQVYRIAVDGVAPGFVTTEARNVILSIRQLALKPVVRDAVWNLDNTVDGTGSVTLATTAKGTLSGKMVVGAKTYPFKGQFDSRGYCQVAFPPAPAKPGQFPLAPITLTIDGAGEFGAMTVDNGIQSIYQFLPQRRAYSTKSPTSLSGYYTFLADGSSSTGIATGSMKVAANGTVKGTGIAHDGTPFTFSSALHHYITLIGGDPVDQLSSYVLLSGKKGYFMHTSTLEEKGNIDELTGTCSYLRPPGKANATLYPDGFLQKDKNIYGSTYTKPISGERALDFLKGTDGVGGLFITNWNNELSLGSVSELINLSTSNKFTFNSQVLKPVLTLNTATGQVTGSITEPGFKKRTLKGMLTSYQGITKIYGVCSGNAYALGFVVQ